MHLEHAKLIELYEKHLSDYALRVLRMFAQKIRRDRSEAHRQNL
jgi:hypothetical protein